MSYRLLDDSITGCLCQINLTLSYRVYSGCFGRRMIVGLSAWFCYCLLQFWHCWPAGKRCLRCGCGASWFFAAVPWIWGSGSDVPISSIWSVRHPLHRRLSYERWVAVPPWACMLYTVGCLTAVSVPARPSGGGAFQRTFPVHRQNCISPGLMGSTSCNLWSRSRSGFLSN